MDYIYGYLTAQLFFGAIWLFMYLKRSDLRREMFFASFLGLPFGAIDYFLVPNYWNPPSIFNLMQTYGIGIESFLFSFFISGIVSVLYEFTNGKKLQKNSAKKISILPYAIFIITFFVLQIFLPLTAIYNLSISLAIGAIVIIFTRKDLIDQVLFGGVFFTLMYFFLFVILNNIFPGYVDSFFIRSNLTILNIFGVPFQELLFAFCGGACWSALFEYIKGYRIVKI